jgi:hypothetical protein
MFLKNKKNIFILLFLIILFILLNEYLKKRSIIENYVTYFLPFYDNEKSELDSFYENKDYNRYNIKKQIIYKPIYFGFLKGEQDYTTRSLIMLLLAKSNIYQVSQKRYNQIKDIIQDLNENRIQLSLLSFPYISYFSFYRGETPYNYNNIKYLLSIYKKYLYPITKRVHRIENLGNIPYGTKIGVVKDGVTKTGNVISHDILTFMGYREGSDYQYIEYESDLELLAGFAMGQFELMMYIGYFPDTNLNKFLEKSVSEEVYILPFTIPRESVFYEKNFQYYQEYIDLNLTSKNYLPKRFNGEEWNQFKPDLKSLCFDEYLITNSKVDDDIIYNIMKTYYENIDKINEFPEIKNRPLSKVNIERDTNMPILYHPGSQRFYEEKGFITNSPNPNCRYMVGVMKCDEKSLKDNNLQFY